MIQCHSSFSHPFISAPRPLPPRASHPASRPSVTCHTQQLIVTPTQPRPHCRLAPLGLGARRADLPVCGCVGGPGRRSDDPALSPQTRTHEQT
eukprot:scaffold21332_cov148-Isochrysis_galbana.AAC.4